jgi:thiamine biosynthesis lipoprotein ApbE
MSRPAPPAAVTFRALGTVVSVLVTEPAQRDLADAILRAELAEVDAACSRFRDDSELSRLNRAGGREMTISRYFADALAVALTAAEATDGDVDPTCGRSLIAIGYDRDFDELRRQPAAPPGPPAGRLTITGAPAAGWWLVELDRIRCTARVPRGVLLDLGATAKALAADRAALRIAEALGCGVLVNLGGDIRVAGPPPEGGWRIGIADDLAPDDAPEAAAAAQTVVITAGGLATSSTKVRSWRRGAASLHHIIAPETGLPAQTCWRTASVAAASCVDANAASTAAVIRGERAPRWLDALHLPARLVRHDGTVVIVADWPAENRRPVGATGSLA